jgi:protein-S-isoprenylcysteine O-methyltransferase Ste14
VFSVTVFPLIVFAYMLLARREEKLVIAEFGDEYRAYRQRVPMFFPRMGQWRELIARSNITEDKSEHPMG